VANVLQHRHEPGAEKLDVAILVAAGAVDGRDLDAADAGAGELLHLPGEILAIDRAAGPPPAHPRLVRALGLRPGGTFLPGGLAAIKSERDERRDDEQGGQGAHGTTVPYRRLR
jgi:hypothetical protein